MYKVRRTNSGSISIDFNGENIIYNLESSLTKSDIENFLEGKEKLSSIELTKLIREKENSIDEEITFDLQDDFEETLTSVGDTLIKKLIFLSKLTSVTLKRYKAKPILVGGTAVEFYTGGMANSIDIDVIYFSNKELEEILKKDFDFLEFTKCGKDWTSEKYGIYFESPDSELDGDTKRVNNVIDERLGLNFYIISLEDLVLDRLKAFVEWKEKEKKDQIISMIDTSGKDFNFDTSYIRETLNRNGYSKYIEIIKKDIELNSRFNF